MLSEVAVVTAPNGEPIERAAAKRFLRLDGDSLDGDVDLLIAAARDDVERATGLRLLDQDVEFLADAFGDVAVLPVGPVREIASIHYLDADGTEQLLDPTSYRITGRGLSRGIAWEPGALVPSVNRSPGSIRVSLSVGYGAEPAAVPAQLRWAMLALISGKFNDRAVDIEPQIVNYRLWG